MKTTSTRPGDFHAAQTSARIAAHKVLDRHGEDAQWQATQQAAAVFARILGGKPDDHMDHADAAMRAELVVAAAPALLAALEKLADASETILDAMSIEDDPHDHDLLAPALNAARAALAKAKGGAL